MTLTRLMLLCFVVLLALSILVVMQARQDDPTTGYLAFVRGSAAAREVVLLNPATGRTQPYASNYLYTPQWAQADHGLVAVISTGTVKEVVILDRAGTVVSTHQVGVGELQSLRWSPDDAQLAAIHYEFEGGTQYRNSSFLVGIDPFSGAVVHWAPDAHIVLAYAWRPDGDGLVYAAADRQRSTSNINAFISFYHVDKVDEAPRLLQATSLTADEDWSLSPDGRFVLWPNSEPNLDEGWWRLDLQTGETLLVDELSYFSRSITWSPDGEWIAYFFEKGLYRMRPDGQENQALSPPVPELVSQAFWSPNGTEIAYYTTSGCTQTVNWLSLQTNQRRSYEIGCHAQVGPIQWTPPVEVRLRWPVVGALWGGGLAVLVALQQMRRRVR